MTNPGVPLTTTLPIEVRWSNVSLAVKIKNQAAKQVEEKVILNDVHGSASPGQLVVLMGPSGAGKSSMLDVIAGRNRNFTGSVTVNGHKWNKAMNRYASYVMQDDVFYATLTVKEHLMFQAELRMGKSFNAEEREARVDYVIEELGLTKCRDSQIGGVTDVRGLSGGERKRLSFATEILTNPSLLFVDEPTSGLDSFMAESVVLQLQKLAREGRTVVATIHQPSSELFTLFDQLYLLSGGQTIYNGKASDAVAYFASQGLPCPNFMNPTEYFMRQITMLDAHSASATRVDNLVRAWQQRSRPAEETAPTTSSWMASAGGPVEDIRLGPLRQLRVLCSRNIRRLVRDKLEFQARLLQTIFCSVLVGLIYWQMAVDQAGIQGYSGALFLLTVTYFVNHTSPEFATVPAELPILDREYRGGLYDLWVWYIAKNVSEVGIQVLFPTVGMAVTYFMVGFPTNWTVFISFVVYLVLLTSAAVGLGYMVSCMTRYPDVANIVGITIMLPMMIFGGFLLNASTTPAYLVWLEYLSPLKYCFCGLSRAFWTTVAVIPCAPGQPCVATSGVDVLAVMSLDERSMVIDVAALVGVNLLFRAIGVVWLWRNLRGLA